MKKGFVIEVVQAERGEAGWEAAGPRSFTVEDDGFGPIRADVKKSVIDSFSEGGVRGEVVATGDITGMLWESGSIDEEYLQDTLRKVMVFLCKVGVEISNDAYDLGRLRSLKILDLGCGNDGSFHRGMFSPWFCRGLHALGADITGVDKVEVNEEWKFKKLDLAKSGALEQFGKNSFDVINMKDVLGHRESPVETDPTVFRGDMYPEFNSPVYRVCEDEIFRQALRILKPGGLFLINNAIYKKVGETVFFRFVDVSGMEDKVDLSYIAVDDSFVL